MIEIRNKKHHTGAWFIRHGDLIDSKLLIILKESFPNAKIEVKDFRASSGNKVRFTATLQSNRVPILHTSAFDLVETVTQTIQGEMIIESRFGSTNGACPNLEFQSYVRVYYK